MSSDKKQTHGARREEKTEQIVLKNLSDSFRGPETVYISERHWLIPYLGLVTLRSGPHMQQNEVVEWTVRLQISVCECIPHRKKLLASRKSAYRVEGL